MDALTVFVIVVGLTVTLIWTICLIQASHVPGEVRQLREAVEKLCASDSRSSAGKQNT